MTRASRAMASVQALGSRGRRFWSSHHLPERQRQLFRIAWLASIAASLLYLVVVLGLGAGQVQQLAWPQYARAWVVGLVVYPASVAVQALAWALGAGYLRRRTSTFDWADVHVYASSYFLRRLPGGLWQVAGRIAAYHEQGIHASQPIVATVAELFLTASTAGVLYLAFRFLPFGGLFGGLALAAGASALIGWVTGQILAVAPRARASTSDSGSRLTAGVVYAAIAELYLAAFLVGGLILMGFVHAGGQTAFSPADAFQLWGLAAVTVTVVGLLPFLVGAREVTVTLLLTRYVDAPVAVVIALLFRLLFIAGDLLWGFILLLIASRLRSSKS